MKFNDFEKDYLIKSIFDELIQNFQNFSLSKKNGVLGAIQYDHLIDDYGLHELVSGEKFPSANAFDGFERLRKYNNLFSSYIDLLIEKDNSTIYPSKESFVKNLFIYGEYTLFNFAYASEIVGVTFSDGEKGDIAIIGNSESKKSYTRVRKGLTVRFFNFYSDSHEVFFSGKHLYTLTLDNVTNNDFYDLFKASRFKYSHEDYETYYESELNRFIKQLIKDGLEYDATHYDEITHCIPVPLLESKSVSNGDNGFFFRDVQTGDVFFKKESDTSFIPDNGLHINDCISINNMTIEIVSIVINSHKEQLICYKKVKKND